MMHTKQSIKNACFRLSAADYDYISEGLVSHTHQWCLTYFGYFTSCWTSADKRNSRLQKEQSCKAYTQITYVTKSL